MIKYILSLTLFAVFVANVQAQCGDKDQAIGNCTVHFHGTSCIPTGHATSVILHRLPNPLHSVCGGFHKWHWKYHASATDKASGKVGNSGDSNSKDGWLYSIVYPVEICKWLLFSASHVSGFLVICLIQARPRTQSWIYWTINLATRIARANLRQFPWVPAPSSSPFATCSIRLVRWTTNNHHLRDLHIIPWPSTRAVCVNTMTPNKRCDEIVFHDRLFASCHTVP